MMGYKPLSAVQLQQHTHPHSISQHVGFVCRATKSLFLLDYDGTPTQLSSHNSTPNPEVLAILQGHHKLGLARASMRAC